MVKWRILAIALAGTALGGCAINEDALIIGRALWQQVVPPEAEKLPLEQIAAIPYATMGLQLGSLPQTLLVLGAQTPLGLEWVGAGDVFVFTNEGRVLRTAGLPFDRGGLFPGPEAPDASERNFLWDVPDLNAYSVPIRCSVTYAGSETIEILGVNIATRRRVESCVSELYDWEFEDNYWEDAETGFVWRSVQNIHPQLPPIALDVLRPAVSAPNGQ
jgi:hypothetical protein